MPQINSKRVIVFSLMQLNVLFLIASNVNATWFWVIFWNFENLILLQKMIDPRAWDKHEDDYRVPFDRWYILIADFDIVLKPVLLGEWNSWIIFYFFNIKIRSASLI